MCNLHRIMVYWPAVTAHLIEVASHDNASLRNKSVEALTKLVHAALAFPREPPIQNSPGLQQVREQGGQDERERKIDRKRETEHGRKRKSVYWCVEERERENESERKKKIDQKGKKHADGKKTKPKREKRQGYSIKRARRESEQASQGTTERAGGGVKGAGERVSRLARTIVSFLTRARFRFQFNTCRFD